MEIEFDPDKSAKNVRERGLSFKLAADFDFDTAATSIDGRYAYPEVRYSAIGLINERLFVLIYCLTPTGIRVISLRKANRREIEKYEKKTAH